MFVRLYLGNVMGDCFHVFRVALGFLRDGFRLKIWVMVRMCAHIQA